MEIAWTYHYKQHINFESTLLPKPHNSVGFTAILLCSFPGAIIGYEKVCFCRLPGNDPLSSKHVACLCTIFIVLHLIQINHQPDATIFQFIILTFVYSSTCFGRFPAHHQELNDISGSLWFYLRIVVIVVLFSWLGRPARPRTQHNHHYDTKVKPETAIVVIELMMMGGKTLETCWAVNKRQDNKLKNRCIRLLIYLN